MNVALLEVVLMFGQTLDAVAVLPHFLQRDSRILGLAADYAHRRANLPFFGDQFRWASLQQLAASSGQLIVLVQNAVMFHSQTSHLLVNVGQRFLAVLLQLGDLIREHLHLFFERPLSLHLLGPTPSIGQTLHVGFELFTVAPYGLQHRRSIVWVAVDTVGHSWPSCHSPHRPRVTGRSR